MADSKRKTILNYLRDTTLAGITTGNGYNSTLGTYQRGIEQLDKMPVSKFPAVFITANREERENITVNQCRCLLQVVIEGYVKNSTGVAGLQADLDNLIEDVTRALEADRKLGGLTAKWLEIKSIEADDGDRMPYGAFGMLVEVAYVLQEGA